MGCVLPTGLGQAPARQAALGAGQPLPTGCTTVNKMRGSGMRAAMFAVVTMAAMKGHRLPYEKVNVHGSACVLGHPIGASGARIIVTLIGALRQRGLKRGVAGLCIGGGEATAMEIELF